VVGFEQGYTDKRSSLENEADRTSRVTLFNALDRRPREACTLGKTNLRPPTISASRLDQITQQRESLLGVL